MQWAGKPVKWRLITTSQYKKTTVPNKEESETKTKSVETSSDSFSRKCESHRDVDEDISAIEVRN